MTKQIETTATVAATETVETVRAYEVGALATDWTPNPKQSAAFVALLVGGSFQVSASRDRVITRTETSQKLLEALESMGVPSDRASAALRAIGGLTGTSAPQGDRPETVAWVRAVAAGIEAKGTALESFVAATREEAARRLFRVRAEKLTTTDRNAISAAEAEFPTVADEERRAAERRAKLAAKAKAKPSAQPTA